jgi:hypothetical protein
MWQPQSLQNFRWQLGLGVEITDLVLARGDLERIFLDHRDPPPLVTASRAPYYFTFKPSGSILVRASCPSIHPYRLIEFVI